MRFKTTLIYLALVSLSLSAAALTLGRARGAAWIGLPLDLAVAVQLESSQTASGLCAEADVFYADTKIEPARVQISVEAGTAPDGATVRIRSSVPIDEPVVTVYMRAGCAAKSTRRFVLLADYPTESAPAALPSRPVEIARPVEVVEVAPVVPAATAGPASAPASEASAASAPPSVPAKPVLPPLATEPKKAEKSPHRAPVAQRKAEPTAKPSKPATNKGPRLKLDPLENLTERIKSLEATTTSPPVQEMVQDSSRIQQLQGDVKALLDQAAKNQASLAAMRERLEKAETEQQIPSLLVYLLLALLAACVAAIYVLWTRRMPTVALSSLATSVAAPVETAAASGVAATPIKPYEVPTTEHVDLDDLPFEHAVAVVEPTKDATSAFMTLLEPTPKHYHFNAEKMLDLCQQAAFLQTLGKTNDAIALLEKRIRTNAQDCPLVYLQLLDVLQQSGRNTDFRVVRNGFMQRFNVNVPESASFHDEGKALEAYPGILSHITQVWRSAKALDEIESTVIRRTPEESSARFDLAAFRELILLHGLAHAFVKSPVATQPPAADSEHINLDL